MSYWTSRCNVNICIVGGNASSDDSRDMSGQGGSSYVFPLALKTYNMYPGAEFLENRYLLQITILCIYIHLQRYFYLKI